MWKRERTLRADGRIIVGKVFSKRLNQLEQLYFPGLDPLSSASVSANGASAIGWSGMYSRFAVSWAIRNDSAGSLSTWCINRAASFMVVLVGSKGRRCDADQRCW